MWTVSRLGLQQRLTLTIFVTVTFAAFAIILALFLFSQKRIYEDSIQHSEDMVQAASLAFSRSLIVEDEVVLDAMLHELQSRRELHITEAYVINREGRVRAHSLTDEYNKIYPVPESTKTDATGTIIGNSI